MKRWIVRLEAEERERWEQMVRVGKAAAYKVRHANVLLAVDESPDGPRLTDAEVDRALGITTHSIEMLRRRFVEQGLEACLAGKKQERPSRQSRMEVAWPEACRSIRRSLLSKTYRERHEAL